VLPLEGPVGIMLYRAIMVVCCANFAEQINNLVYEKCKAISIYLYSVHPVVIM
jgi:hypothetical protein